MRSTCFIILGSDYFSSVVQMFCWGKGHNDYSCLKVLVRWWKKVTCKQMLWEAWGHTRDTHNFNDEIRGVFSQGWCRLKSEVMPSQVKGIRRKWQRKYTQDQENSKLFLWPRGYSSFLETTRSLLWLKRWAREKWCVGKMSRELQVKSYEWWMSI